VEVCSNKAGPPAKLKYDLMIYSD